MKHYLTIICSILLIAGCASQTPHDPFESVNRKIYGFNSAVDRSVLRPVAKGYDAVVPKIIDDRVDSFFSNLDDVVVVFNDVLQFKLLQAGSDTGRILVNSTFGVLGLFDVASHMGLEKHNEDFGQTLGYWGVPAGPYLVLPLLGPSTVRDTPTRVVDNQLDPINQFPEEADRYALQGLKYVNIRQRLLDADKLATDAYDEYSFVRDAYLQRRAFMVYDGAVPQEATDEDSALDDEDLDDYDELE